MLHTILALCLIVASVGPGELLSDPEARSKLSQAQAAFKDGDFQAASRAIEAAYLIEPAPTLLYPWAQAERQLGNCRAAIELYQRFIDSGPSAELAAVAQENIDRCNEQLDAAAVVVVDEEDEDDAGDAGIAEVEAISDEELFGTQTEADPEPDPDPGPAAPKTTHDEEPKARQWYTDPAGGVLTGLGVVGIAAGGALLGVASSKAKKVGEEDTNTAYLDARDQATKLRNGGVAALAIGGTLALAGIIRYVVVAKKRKSAASASVWVDPRGTAGIVWVGRF